MPLPELPGRFPYIYFFPFYDKHIAEYVHLHFILFDFFNYCLTKNSCFCVLLLYQFSHFFPRKSTEACCCVSTSTISYFLFNGNMYFISDSAMFRCYRSQQSNYFWIWTVITIKVRFQNAMLNKNQGPEFRVSYQ